MTNSSVKQKVQSHLQSNQPKAALALLRSAMSATPGDADLCLMQGIALGMLSDFEAAVTAFQATVRLAPQAVAAWEHLGRGLYQLGRLEEARQAFEQSHRLNPDNHSTLAALGELHRHMQDYSTSETYLRKALQLRPQAAPLHNLLATTLELSGSTQEAINHYRKALQLAPDFADAHLNLCLALRSTGQLDSALAGLQDFVRKHPQSLPGWHNLAATLLDLNRWRESLELFEKVLDMAPSYYLAHVCIARILITQRELEAAQSHLDKALRLAPAQEPEVCAQVAELAILKGDFTSARQALKPALQQHPDALSLLLVQAQLAERDHTERPLSIDLLENFRNRNPQAPDLAFFALGRLYERAGRYDDAFEAFTAAHARRGLSSDLQQHIEEMDRIEAFFTRDKLRDLPACRDDTRLPIFIVGMPRSGTSLAEQILASHPDVFGAGETTKLWQIMRTLEREAGQTYPLALERTDLPQRQAAAQEYLSHLRALAPAARRICDKLPHNFLHLGLIQLLFPKATVIHCQRDALDTCLSIFTLRFNINHRYARNLEELGHYYRRYRQLMSHWKQTLDLNIHTLDYETLISNQEQESRRLLAAAGLDWDPACMRFFETRRTVVTPSYEQVRQPIYRTSVRRWERYADHLDALRAALRDPKL